MTFRSACLASVLLLGAAMPAAAQAELSCQPAAPIDALLSSFAMNTHMQQGWQYSDAKKTVEVLKDLGISEVREGFVGLGARGPGICGPERHPLSLFRWRRRREGAGGAS